MHAMHPHGVRSLCVDAAGEYAVRHGSTASSLFTNFNSFPVGEWTHVAVVQSRSSAASTDGHATLYWGGYARASETMRFPLAVPRSGLFVGKSHRGGDAMYVGQMRDLFVWDVALTTSELEAVTPHGSHSARTRHCIHVHFWH
jgi:hypothetical protein